MSYILDALRKSEQERQATQPDNVTDRILVSPPQPRPNRRPWLAALILGNVLVIAGVIWYFNHTSTPDIQQKQTHNIVNEALPKIVEQRPKEPEQQAIRQQANTAPAITPKTAKPSQPIAPSPSIAQLIDQNKPKEAPKQVKKAQEKKPQAVKIERGAKASPMAEAMPEPIDDETKSPASIAPPKSTGTPDVKELPYEVRNDLPNLNLNVFSYDRRPEDRFVIIDMVKYKTGQLVKGKVKLKEIRPDSIVLENTDGSTFKVERP